MFTTNKIQVCSMWCLHELHQTCINAPAVYFCPKKAPIFKNFEILSHTITGVGKLLYWKTRAIQRMSTKTMGHEEYFWDWDSRGFALHCTSLYRPNIDTSSSTFPCSSTFLSVTLVFSVLKSGIIIDSTAFDGRFHFSEPLELAVYRYEWDKWEKLPEGGGVGEWVSGLM